MPINDLAAPSHVVVTSAHHYIVGAIVIDEDLARLARGWNRCHELLLLNVSQLHTHIVIGSSWRSTISWIGIHHLVIEGCSIVYDFAI